MPVWLGQLLLALAVCALASAAVRVASLAAPRGLTRVVAAAPLAVGAAVVEALGLGLVGWGGSAIALTAAAIVTWAVVRVLAPKPSWGLRDDLVDWWRGLHREWRMVAGAVAGLFVAYLGFLLRYPELGFDGIVYHLPEVVQWVQGGHTGSVVTSVQGLPLGNYPITGEVAIAWATAIGRSLVPVSVFTPLMLVLLLVAGWVGLRALGVGRWAGALALAAFAVQPLVLEQLTGPNTDLPALAWLVCEAALCAVAIGAKPATKVIVVRQPAGYEPGARVPPGAGGPEPDAPPRALLLVPALVAFFLAIGTKTTVAPLGLIVLAWAAWVLRRELRPVVVPLGGALLLGVLAGGVWYLRNLFDHGSPLWPFVSLPWGDPVPPVIDAVSSSLLERPSATLSNRIDDYVSLLAGGVVLLAGGLVAAVANRRAAIAAGATALSVLLWAAGPVSGASPRIEFADIALSAVRYLLPALACGATALALATLGRRRANDPFAIGAAVVLAGALVWGIVRDAQLGFPTVPGVETLVAGAVIGALVAWLLGWLIVRIPLVATALFAALVLALAAHNYLFHHAEASRSFDQDISRFLAAQPDYADGDAPVAAAPTMAGPLAGDRVTHRLTLIRPDTPCATVRKVAREGYVLLRAAVSVEFRGGVIYPAPITAWRCFAGRQPVFAHNGASIYTLR